MAEPSSRPPAASAGTESRATAHAVHLLRVAPGRWTGRRWRRWREWCFVRALAAQQGPRLLVLFALLVLGGWVYHELGPHPTAPFIVSVFAVWSLVFANPSEPFPAHPVLQVMYFAMPVLGLTVIIESIVEVWALLRDRRRSEERWSRIMASSMSGHVVLVGLGRLGFRVFTILRRLGCPVCVIESNPRNQFLDAVRADGSPIIIGDARTDVTLAKANLPQARAVIAAASDDMANLEVALDARKLAPNIRVVVRMFDQAIADKIGAGLNIPLAMSQSAISAPAFATAAVEPSIVAGVVLDQDLLVMRRIITRAGDGLSGLTVGQLLAAQRVSVVKHRSAGAGPLDAAAEAFPPPETLIGAGDELVIQGTYGAISRLAPGAAS